MRVHPNAKTTPKARALIVQRVDEESWTVAETAEAFGVSTRTVHKWRARYRRLGAAGYSVAMIGGDDRAALWTLSRRRR